MVAGLEESLKNRRGLEDVSLYSSEWVKQNFLLR